MYARLAGQKIAAGCDATSTLKSGTRYSGEPAVFARLLLSPTTPHSVALARHTLLLSQVDSLAVHISCLPPALRTPAASAACPSASSNAGVGIFLWLVDPNPWGGDEPHIGQGLPLYLETAHA
jgi:hypothetical protein